MRRFFCLVLSLLAAPILSAQTVPAPVAPPAAQPTATVPAEAAAPGKDVVHQLNNAFAKVFETVAPSVVIIEVTKKADVNDGPLDDLFFQEPDENDPHHGGGKSGAPEPVQSEGSGFIVRPDGFIYTNYHVVEDAEKVEVKLQDGREMPGKVVGTDEKTDIAVVKIEATNLPVVQLADSDAVRVGQFAFAIGAPFKLDYTFTYGVISGKGRNKLFQSSGYNLAEYLQTDTSINPGNSGGPLCDIDGKVVGMNTLINGLNRGLGFAIPSNLINEIGTQLIAGNKIVRPWLGIGIETLGENASLRDLFKGIDKGVVVKTIQAHAPAVNTGLQPLDVITQVDGAPVATDTQLQHEILKKKVGQNVQLDVWRNGHTMKIAVTTGELPNDPGRAAALPAPRLEPREEELNRFGLQVQELDKEVAKRLKLTVQQGVIVTDVADDSIAAEQDIRREDVITEVDGKPVTNLASFREGLQKGDLRKGILLYLDRKGSRTFAVLKAGG